MLVGTLECKERSPALRICTKEISHCIGTEFVAQSVHRENSASKFAKRGKQIAKTFAQLYKVASNFTLFFRHDLADF